MVSRAIRDAICILRNRVVTRITVDDLLGSKVEVTEDDSVASKVTAKQNDITKSQNDKIFDMLRSIDARLARIESKLP